MVHGRNAKATCWKPTRAAFLASPVPSPPDLFHRDGADHLGMDGAEVLVGARLVEGVLEGVVLVERRRTEAAIDADDGVRLAVIVLPGHGAADRDGDRHRRE